MRPFDMMLGAAVAVLWGGNFVATKFGLGYLPPFLFTGMRFAVVALMLLPFVGRPPLAQIKAILPAACLGALHFSLLVAAMYYGLDISTSALVGQLGVPFACLLGAVFLKDKIGKWQVSGIVIAFLGIMIVAGTPNITAHPTAFYLALGSTLTWGMANIFIKRVGDIPSMQLLGWMALFMIPILLILSRTFESEHWPTLAQPIVFSSIAGLMYTAIGSTIFAYGIWYYLLNKYTVSQVAPFSLPTPIFGIAFGQFFFSEALTPHIFVGGFITIVGVAIIVIRRPKLAINEAT